MKYIVISEKRWNKKMFDEKITNIEGDWYYFDYMPLFQEIKKINPKYIFFPHWSQIVDKDIVDSFDCVCFHETDLPFGRGGSPIQNLILAGHEDTVITAFKMDDKIDSGPIYLKRPVSLHGSLEEIFIRSSEIVAEMISDIVENNPEPVAQEKLPIAFKRRNPAQSEISLTSLKGLFDFIRMLDADTYPKAFINHEGFKIEFTNASLKTDKIKAYVEITRS